MLAARTILMIWCVLLTVFTLPGSFISPTFGRIAWACFAAVMLTAAIGCVWNIRSCWCIALLGCLISFVSYAPMVVQNTYMFLTNHPLYYDSPATIFVVVALALFFLLPPSLISVCLLLDRRRFVQVFRTAAERTTDTGSVTQDPATRSTGNPYQPPHS